jgi:hypothetical protein
VISYLRNLDISPFSVLLIFLSGIIFAWLLSRLIKNIPKVIQRLRKGIGTIQGSFSTSAETRLQNDTYRFAQKQHLAASLFSLNEIAIVPKVLTPLIQVPNSIDLAPTDSVCLTVPYIPDWPELAAVYKSSTMTLVEALQGGANIILTGHPGSGKTVALAWLASSIAHHEPGLGVLEGVLPLYIHATVILDLIQHIGIVPDNVRVTGPINQELPKSRLKIKTLGLNDILDLLIEAISTYASPLTLSKLPVVIREALENQRALLIVDRVDELPPTQARAITEYLRTLLECYPKLRIIAAASYEDLAGLPAIGFSLLAMAAWGDDERASFLQRWSQLWVKWIYSSEKNPSKKIKSYYMNSWLKDNNTLLKPIEYVLKVWAAYSGDILGADGPSAIEAYIRRMTNNVSNAREGLEHVALQLLLAMGDTSEFHEPDSSKSDQEVEADLTLGDQPSESKTSEIPHPIKYPHIKDLSGADTLTSNGFLVRYAGSLFGFSHPIFCAYLAANVLSAGEEMNQIRRQPHWIGKTLALYYLARNGDVTSLINTLIQEDDILHTNHLLIARWLHIAPKNRPWRIIVLRTLTSILQKEKDTLSLAAKIISAMAFSGDVGVIVFFRQLLKSDHPNLKQLAALGCGILAEKKAIEDLNSLLQEQSPQSIRAASLALAAIGDKQSLEILASGLLSGSELTRRSAAEALAINPKEGHPALMEGSTHEDLLVRRSVAFGLIRIDQPWAIKIVENLQLEDNEWVVRNAAVQAFDELSRKNNFAPRPLADPTETQWLINYAASIGTTVAPGKPADELVIKALANGSQDEVLNALDYLRNKCDPETIEYIYAAYLNTSGECKDVAYYVLWLMMIAGINLPLAIKYNIK